MTGTPVTRDDTVTRDYAEWLQRVHATFAAVRYTCTHRLVDARLAEQVGVQVVAGLVARPSVFRYFGLPFSGRIARLAEARIAEADAGELAVVCGWSELSDRLARVPAGHRDPLVVICVRGGDVRALAAHLGCDEAAAERRRTAMLGFMEELAAPGLPPAPDPDPVDGVPAGAEGERGR